MILRSDDGYNCDITPEEWDYFRIGHGGITPCQVYKRCEACPYAREEEE